MKYPAFTGNEPCTQFDPDMYYPNPTEANEREYKAVRALCRECPMQVECLEWAVHHERYGNWGGCTMREIETIRIQRRIRLTDASFSLYAYQQREAS